MNGSQRAALVRISVMLFIACVAAFTWEWSRYADWKPAVGEVVGVAPAYKGPEFTIRYSMQGQTYEYVTKLGIVDVLGRFGDLELGDEVPLAVDSQAPDRVIRKSLNGRYGVTLCFVMLTLCSAAATTIAFRRGKE